VWREIVRLYKRAAARGKALGGRLLARPDGGLEYDDGRQIIGLSTDDPDKFNGFSGNVLFIVDEGSGVADSIFEAIEGNSAGGGDIFGEARPSAERVKSGKIVVTGNPTKTAGKFYRIFRDPRERTEWHLMHVSSIEAAEYQRDIGQKVGYIATLEWVQKKRRAWGESSPLWFVRVLGDFPPQSELALIGLQLVESAAERWQVVCGALQRFSPIDRKTGRPYDLNAGEGSLDLFSAYEVARRGLLDAFDSLTEEERALCETLRRPISFGQDVARFGSDASALAPVRGDFCYPMLVVQSMDGIDVATKAIEAVQALRFMPGDYGARKQVLAAEPWRAPAVKPPSREKPRVKVDVIGPGASCFDSLARHHREEVEAVPVNVAEKATDETSYRLRDQLWQAARDWLKDGGMLPPDDKLHSELLAPDYEHTSAGKVKVEDKDALREKLPSEDGGGRSPDRADALCLAVYNPPSRQPGRSTINVLDR